MKLINRSSQSAKSAGTAITLRIATIVAALLAAPALLHALVPTSLVILEISLDVCQFCVSVLRLCAM